MAKPERIRRLSYQKAKKLEKLIGAVEKRLSLASSELTKSLLKEFLSKLRTDSGAINDALNRNTVTLFNKAFNAYAARQKTALINSVLKDISTIFSDNHDFYKRTVVDFSLDREALRSVLDRRLGIAPDGTLIRNGYMDGLLDDASIRSDVQRFLFREIFKGSGYEYVRGALKEFIEGNPKKFGAFQKHYKTFTYDAYAQINSYISGLYSQKLGMTYFIYNGGLIETSRSFCIKRNAGAYSTEEAEKWSDDPELTAIESRENYNWLIDRGGFNCRHSIDFIAKEDAFVLRPDLKNR
jgi:hypothetical protein